MRRNIEQLSAAFDRDGKSAIDPWELSRLTRFRKRAMDPKVQARAIAHRNRMVALSGEDS